MLNGRFVNVTWEISESGKHSPANFYEEVLFKISLTALGLERATSRLGSRRTKPLHHRSQAFETLYDSYLT